MKAYFINGFEGRGSFAEKLNSDTFEGCGLSRADTTWRSKFLLDACISVEVRRFSAALSAAKESGFSTQGLQCNTSHS